MLNFMALLSIHTTEMHEVLFNVNTETEDLDDDVDFINWKNNRTVKQ